MRQAHRFGGPGGPYEGLTKLGSKGPVWTGAVRLVEEKLSEPLRWRKPQKVFVNSMSDLFHEDVPALFIARVFATMAKAHHHTFQVLTKRADRMREVLTDPTFRDNVMASLVVDHGEAGIPPWPLPNVLLGVSVEDQQRADERIPLLLATPAAVRFLSMEPLLGPVDPFTVVARWQDRTPHAERRHVPLGRPLLDWVIVGGESGPGARPCHVDWIRSVVAQCKAAAVPCFTKQLGARPQLEPHVLDGVPVSNPLRLESKKGSDMSEWPVDLRVREFPEVARG